MKKKNEKDYIEHLCQCRNKLIETIDEMLDNTNCKRTLINFLSDTLANKYFNVYADEHSKNNNGCKEDKIIIYEALGIDQVRRYKKTVNEIVDLAILNVEEQHE